MGENKTIFISYSQDSEIHAQKALDLSKQLEGAGFQCYIDQVVGMDAVSEGLSVWMSRGVLNADYVLLVCSDRYGKLLTGEIQTDTTAAGSFESVFSYNELAGSVSLNKKLIPVIFDEFFRKSVPESLAERKVFLLDDEFEALAEVLKQGEDVSLPEVVPVTAAPEVVKVEGESPAASFTKKVEAEQVSMADLMAASDFSALQEKTLVIGTITEMTDQEVSIDVGSKAEGVIPKNEFSDSENLSIGQRIEIYVEKPEGADARPVLSYEKARQIRAWEELSKNGEVGTVVNGRVISATKRGLVVNIGIDCFLPASQVDVRFVSNLESYVGQTLELVIVKIDLSSRFVVVSRRALLEEKRQKRCREFFDSQKVGDIVLGTVSSIRDFGAFVDLDGLEGLVPMGELGFTRVEHPSEVVAVGESVRVKITSIDEERVRIGLSLKDAMVNPWDGIEENYPVGKQVHGKVVSMVPFGAFVEVEPGIQGLIHLSEFSWKKRVNKPEEMLKLNETVAAVVVQVSAEEQKMGLSLKQMDENPWTAVERNHAVGNQVAGTVTRLSEFGAFVALDEGVEGLVHISDMSWKKRPRHPSEMVKVGDKLNVVILNIDSEAQRISLGMKQALDDPWEDIETLYKLGSIITGKVTRIASFGAFVEVSSQIEGLVHISQIQEDRVNRVDDVLKVGDEVKARVVNIDKNERKMGLSIKAANDEDYEAEVKAVQKAQGSAGSLNNLGDIFDQLTQK